MPVPDCTVRGTGAVVLFLHGVGGGAMCWEPQLDHFAQKFTAAAWDMPGYGKSVLDGRMTFATLALALSELLDDRGWDRVHLVGHSMGGMVAQELAVWQQHRLASLTLFATSPAFGRPDGEFQKQFVEARLAPLSAGASMSDLADDVVGTMFGPSADMKGREIARRAMADLAPDTYRAAVECIVSFDRRDNLPLIEVPTLVLAGETDTNAPAPMMERMAAKIAGARYECLRGLGHLANLENPSMFNSVLDDFLD